MWRSSPSTMVWFKAKRLQCMIISFIKKGETMLAIPYDERVVLTPALARDVVFKNILPNGYDGWTGDAGLVALLLLNEVACSSNKGGVLLPKRQGPLQDFWNAYISCLPSPKEMANLHPLLWSEEDQEVLQSHRQTRFIAPWMM